MEKKIQCNYSNINKSTYKFSIYNYLIFEIQEKNNLDNLISNIELEGEKLTILLIVSFLRKDKEYNKKNLYINH